MYFSWKQLSTLSIPTEKKITKQASLEFGKTASISKYNINMKYADEEILGDDIIVHHVSG